ncbi:MAG: alanine--glyoxylate aminotransferase family protein [Rhodospirillales bacterium]
MTEALIAQEREPVVTLSAGPVACYPRVLRAMSQTVHYDYDPFFQEAYELTALRCGQALRLNGPALVLQCEPAPAIEAAAASLIGPEDHVLNLVSGVYGKGFGYWAARHAKQVSEIEVAYNEAIDPAAVEAALAADPSIRLVSLVHHDTPSGTVNPLVEIGRIVAKHEALLLVDAVSSFAGMDIHPGDCAADVFITGPGKCLGGPPSLSVLAVSDAAWARMEANPTAPRASILSLLDWKDAWRRGEPFPFTPSVAAMNGLDAAMAGYLEEGPEAVWARHGLTAAACRAGIEALGLKLWAARPEVAAPTCTAVAVPEGLDDKVWRATARRLYGVVFSGGVADTQGKLIRIGHMGPVAEPLFATVAVTALGGALQALGQPADLAAGQAAAMAVIADARS